MSSCFFALAIGAYLVSTILRYVEKKRIQRMLDKQDAEDAYAEWMYLRTTDY